MAANVLRLAPDRRLDRRYLRVAAVYRLLSRGRIRSKARAVELLSERGVPVARQTVELWLAHPLENLTFKA